MTSAVNYKVDQIISDIRNNAGLPENDRFLGDQDYVQFLNLMVKSKIVPKMMGMRLDYFLTTTDYTITSNEDTYALPPDAIGLKLRALHWFNEGTPANSETNIQYLSPDLIANSLLNSTIEGFYIKGNNFVLFPIPTNPTPPNDTIRAYYYRRPHDLVIRTSGAVIESINTGTNQVVVDAMPTAWVVDTTLDAVQQVPPFNLVAEDITLDAIGGGDTLTLSSVDGLSVGDTLAASGTTIVPMLPVEIHPLLTQAGVVMALKAKRDTAGVESAQAEYNEMATDAWALLAPRVDDSPQQITGVGGISSYIGMTGWY